MRWLVYLLHTRLVATDATQLGWSSCLQLLSLAQFHKFHRTLLVLCVCVHACLCTYVLSVCGVSGYMCVSDYVCTYLCLCVCVFVCACVHMC